MAGKRARSGRRTRFSNAAKERIATMHDIGVSQEDIARSFGTTQQTISRILASHETHTENKFTADDWDTMAADPEAWMRTQTNGLQALRRIGLAYEAKCTSGPVGVPRDDWDELVAQRQRLFDLWDVFPFETDRPYQQGTPATVKIP